MTINMFNESGIAHWIQLAGYAGIAAIVFAETAFFFCFFLPGDSLLFTAGMLAGNHILNLYVLIPIVILAAFFGYWVGYYIGLYFGHRLATKKDTWYYKKQYTINAHVFMNKYGKLALLLGRLIAVIRTFIPVIAGMGEMPIISFLLFNFMGAVFWGISIPLLGFYLGKSVPDISSYVTAVLIGIVAVSVLPAVIAWWKKP